MRMHINPFKSFQMAAVWMRKMMGKNRKGSSNSEAEEKQEKMRSWRIKWHCQRNTGNFVGELLFSRRRRTTV